MSHKKGLFQYRTYIFQAFIFKGHVSLPGSKSPSSPTKNKGTFIHGKPSNTSGTNLINLLESAIPAIWHMLIAERKHHWSSNINFQSDKWCLETTTKNQVLLMVESEKYHLEELESRTWPLQTKWNYCSCSMNPEQTFKYWIVCHARYVLVNQITILKL